MTTTKLDEIIDRLNGVMEQSPDGDICPILTRDSARAILADLVRAEKSRADGLAKELDYWRENIAWESAINGGPLDARATGHCIRETIGALKEQLAEKTAEVERLNTIGSNHYLAWCECIKERDALREQLATARTALENIIKEANDDSDWRFAFECMDQIATKALAQITPAVVAPNDATPV